MSAIIIPCGICCDFFDPWICSLFPYAPLYWSAAIAGGLAIAVRRLRRAQ